VRYRIELTPAVEKTLSKLAKKNRPLLNKVDQSLLALVENPTPTGCKQLVGQVPNLYRLRIGDYRIIYKVENDVLVILVVHIGHRKDVYRYLHR
jgi:mRNA interferase RelE/StbE